MQSDFDGAELFARPSIELVAVEAKAIRDAESEIVGCEHCRPDESDLPFDCVLADVLDKPGPYEFAMVESARCPRCKATLAEKTLVEMSGGIEVEVTA